MLLPSQKPSSSSSLFKFVYVTSQLRYSLVVHNLLTKILDLALISLIKGLETSSAKSPANKSALEFQK